MSGDREQFMTPHEVAELLMVSPVTVRQWAQKGMLPALTTAGGHRRFRWDDVERFAREKGMQLPDRTTTVLVVDDDRQLNNYLVALLSTSVDDVEVVSAYDGFEAGKLVQQARPDIVLLDVMMPGMDGVQVCRSIKSDANTAHAGHHHVQQHDIGSRLLDQLTGLKTVVGADHLDVVNRRREECHEVVVQLAVVVDNQHRRRSIRELHAFLARKALDIVPSKAAVPPGGRERGQHALLRPLANRDG